MSHPRRQPGVSAPLPPTGVCVAPRRRPHPGGEAHRAGEAYRAEQIGSAAMDVPLLRLHDATPQPAYATPGSVGFDLCTAEAVDIAPGAIELVGTGLVVATPPGWSLLVCLRSSTPRRFGVLQPHGIGVIDEDYRGPRDELRLQLLNFTPKPVHIPTSSRIAQGVFVRAERATWRDHRAEPSSRGGFGSTGA